jgi:hypothetical protein
MGRRITVVVEPAIAVAENPLGHGFTRRYELLLTALRSHGDVTVIGLTGPDEPTQPFLDEVVISDGVVRWPHGVGYWAPEAMRTWLGPWALRADARALRRRVIETSPDLIVALCVSRRELGIDLVDLAPVIVFAEEMLPGDSRPSWGPGPSTFAKRCVFELRRRLLERAAVVCLVAAPEAIRFSRQLDISAIVVPLPMISNPMPSPSGDQIALLVTGDLLHARNVDGLLRVLNALDQRGWPAGLTIRCVSAGGYAEPLVARQGPQLILLPPQPNLDDELRKARGVLVPGTFASGIKTQILVGWSARRCVIATPSPAATVEGRDGVDLLIGADANSIASIIIGLSERADLEEIAQRGLERVEAEFTVVAQDEALSAAVALAEETAGRWDRARH